MKRALVKMLRGTARARQLHSGQLQAMSTGAFWVLRAFYLVASLIAFDRLRTSVAIARRAQEVDPLWPVLWIEWTGLTVGAHLIGVLCIVATLAAVVFPLSRLPRIGTFLGFLFFSALENSFGSINHYMHYPIWISALLIFMPCTRPPKAGASTAQHYFYAYPIFAAQAFIGLFYTLSGLEKLDGAFPSKSNDVSSLSPEALPLLATGRWDKTGIEPMMAQFFVDNIWIGWPAYLLVIYLETVFLIAVFRPALHKFFGLALACFHLGVFMVMGIIFPYQAVLVSLLFIMSPFAERDRFDFGVLIRQLPGVGILLILATAIKQLRSQAR